ncbi:hypothetical protein NDU88_003208 [Pleurodeles waltl]|uniref:Uncharacterized protein n=1 Tax=Pleurodeles waltl TaxID=8319 RepID=A0AAV7LGA6_PLEWA|nr:hypothetical protein NDU88_003208 [Pleurodeles waltl]
MDWRRRRDGQKQVSEQPCDNSVSRIEIQQDGTTAVVDPEQAIKLADSSHGGVEMLSVNSRFCWSLVDTAVADPPGVMCLALRRMPRLVGCTGNAKDIGLKGRYINLYFTNGGKCFSLTMIGWEEGTVYSVFGTGVVTSTVVGGLLGVEV